MVGSFAFVLVDAKIGIITCLVATHLCAIDSVVAENGCEKVAFFRHILHTRNNDAQYRLAARG